MTAPSLMRSQPDAQERPPGGRLASPSLQAAARHRGRVAAGVALMVLSALLAVLIYGNLGQREPVLAAARELAPGQVITDADLKVVNVAAGPGVALVPAAQRSSLVGQRAAVGLGPGALLTPASMRGGPAVPAGNTVIGTVVKPGQYPIGLREGDQVMVLVAGAASTSGAPNAPSGGVDAVIVAVSTRTGPEGTAVALAVPAAEAAALALAGAEGRLVLMQPVR